MQSAVVALRWKTIDARVQCDLFNVFLPAFRSAGRPWKSDGWSVSYQQMSLEFLRIAPSFPMLSCRCALFCLLSGDALPRSWGWTHPLIVCVATGVRTCPWPIVCPERDLGQPLPAPLLSVYFFPLRIAMASPMHLRVHPPSPMARYRKLPPEPSEPLRPPPDPGPPDRCSSGPAAPALSTSPPEGQEVFAWQSLRSAVRGSPSSFLRRSPIGAHPPISPRASASPSPPRRASCRPTRKLASGLIGGPAHHRRTRSINPTVHDQLPSSKASPVVGRRRSKSSALFAPKPRRAGAVGPLSEQPHADAALMPVPAPDGDGVSARLQPLAPDAPDAGGGAEQSSSSPTPCCPPKWLSSPKCRAPEPDARAPEPDAAKAAQPRGLESYSSFKKPENYQPLYDSERIEAALRRLWVALPKFRPDRLEETVYKWYYARLYAIVVPDGSDHEMRVLADNEWKAESHGQSEMEFPRFYDAMFNFVYLWCPLEGVDEYVGYVEDVCMRAVADDPGEVKRKPAGADEGPQHQSPSRTCSEDAPGYAPSAGLIPNLPELVSASNDRIAQYTASGKSNRAIYLQECARLRIEPAPELTRQMSTEPGVYKLKEIQAHSLHIPDVQQLVDVLRINKRLEVLVLKNCGLTNASIIVLGELMGLHPSIQMVDFSNTQLVNCTAAQALYRMVCRNTSITTARLHGILPGSLRTKLLKRVEMNFRSRTLSRDAYADFRRAFQEMDTDGNDAVDFAELTRYFQNHYIEMRPHLSGDRRSAWRKSSSAMYSLVADDPPGSVELGKCMQSQRQAEKKAASIFADSKHTLLEPLAFANFLKYYYPRISLEVIHMFIETYENESNPLIRQNMTTGEVSAIFDAYDTDGDGRLTVDELRKGLVGTGLQRWWEYCQKLLPKYHLNGEDKLSFEEFWMLMSVIDPCPSPDCRALGGSGLFSSAPLARRNTATEGALPLGAGSPRISPRGSLIPSPPTLNLIAKLASPRQRRSISMSKSTPSPGLSPSGSPPGSAHSSPARASPPSSPRKKDRSPPRAAAGSSPESPRLTVATSSATPPDPLPGRPRKSLCDSPRGAGACGSPHQACAGDGPSVGRCTTAPCTGPRSPPRRGSTCASPRRSALRCSPRNSSDSTNSGGSPRGTASPGHSPRRQASPHGGLLCGSPFQSLCHSAAAGGSQRLGLPDDPHAPRGAPAPGDDSPAPCYGSASSELGSSFQSTSFSNELMCESLALSKTLSLAEGFLFPAGLADEV